MKGFELHYGDKTVSAALDKFNAMVFVHVDCKEGRCRITVRGVDFDEKKRTVWADDAVREGGTIKCSFTAIDRPSEPETECDEKTEASELTIYKSLRKYLENKGLL